MKEHPILFSGAMVRALLAGAKTQTRRAVKPQPTHFNPAGVPRRIVPDGGPSEVIRCPYGQPGDRLWVREHWRAPQSVDHLPPRSISDSEARRFIADEVVGPDAGFGKARRAFHMPRWASRITLEITGVRVERLQDISEADALAEGVTPKWEPGCSGRLMEAFSGFSFRPAASAYADLWEQINGPGSWDANPWVWAVEFRRVEG